jgi:hypothetical protein
MIYLRVDNRTNTPTGGMTGETGGVAAITAAEFCLLSVVVVAVVVAVGVGVGIGAVT